MKLQLKGYGKYLGTEKLNFKVKDRNGVIASTPFQSIAEIELPSGNYVSTKALAWASIYDIKCLVTSQSGRPLGVFLPLTYDKNVKTRVSQYEASFREKGCAIAKTIAKTKIEAQSALLSQHGIEHSRLKKKAASQLECVRTDRVEKVRTKLHSIEGHFGKFYFKEVIKLFPSSLQVKFRMDHKAVEMGNNLFNLSYDVLKWEVFKAVINAHLDPYLGFLHSMQHGKPSLVCDLQEPYRPLIDDFLIDYSHTIGREDHTIKYGERNPREFLKHQKSSHLIASLNTLLNRRVKARNRKSGRFSKFRTVIREDIKELAGFLRNELDNWVPTNLLAF